MQRRWQRMIALVDMNCFFASVEQQDNPEWRYRPVAVTNGQLGTTIITSSYEARAYGVTTGMRLKQARALCPHLIQAPSRPQRYSAISTRIMAALHNISPDIEIYSVDEAFLDLTYCQHLYVDPLDIGQQIKHQIAIASGGLRCSVGISGDKTTAKFAAKQQKPDGLTIIEPPRAAAVLAPHRISELAGINKGIAGFLAQYGVHHCGDMAKIPISILAKRYGNLGRRIWLMAQGRDPEPLQFSVSEPKTMGHGKVLPPDTRDKKIILTYLQHMSEKVAARLRRYHYHARHFFIGLKTEQGWIKYHAHLPFDTDDGHTIAELCRQFMVHSWRGQGVWQVQVTALQPQHSIQRDLFHIDNQQQRRQLNQAIDNVNERYGEFTVAPARLLNRSEMPNVLAPGWQPQGHRKYL